MPQRSVSGFKLLDASRTLLCVSVFLRAVCGPALPGLRASSGASRAARPPPPHIKRGSPLRLLTPLNSLQHAAGRVFPGVRIPGGRGEPQSPAFDPPHAGAPHKDPCSPCGAPSGAQCFWRRPGRAREARWLSPRGDTEQGGPPQTWAPPPSNLQGAPETSPGSERREGSPFAAKSKDSPSHRLESELEPAPLRQVKGAGKVSHPVARWCV